ncbi:hypothetical protein CTAYLR_001916 [Chrysophaeum taylorii]|uniref:COP9 signalosome complex subunit 4 n=1 Tax=Chrysophaeum taylorii TaxID=2483200 RepID=A0AAD7XL99_9STRA|nr:hypothetical protein CTAYLR_001916 [Chrysophaeum taylorii]
MAEAQLAALVSSSLNPTERAAQFAELIDECIGGEDVGSLQLILEKLVSDEVPQVVSRSAVSHYANAVRMLRSGEALEAACQHALRTLAPQVSSFEESDARLRHALFDALLGQGSFKEAACVLAGINMETSQRVYSDVEKASTYVKIAETFLEDDESVDAETFVTRASGLMHAVPGDDWALQLRYRVTLARTLDARRKFLDAAMRYYELSQARHREVATDELVALLSKAVTCAVLGNAGPQRSRILAMLYKDERVGSHMEPSPEYAPHATLLKKMCTGQLVTKHDIAAFEATLLPHQKALQADGLTIPDRATIQHNLVAVSRIYDNISLSQLGLLLEIEPHKAERVASRMIAEGRLPGATIDQVDSDILFSPPQTPLHAFDLNIAHVCADVNAVYDKVDKLLEAYQDTTTNTTNGGAPPQDPVPMVPAP